MNTSTRPSATVRVTSRLSGGFIDGIEATISVLNEQGIRVGERVVTARLAGLEWPVAGDVWNSSVSEAEAAAVWGALDLMVMNELPQ
jgi:hypothetical protein